MSKVTVTPITNANNLSNINNNFASLAAELNDKVLYRANPVGEANQMVNTLDMNDNPIINASSISTDSLLVGGVDLVGTVESAAAAAASSAATALASATQSDASAASAASSASNAASTLAGALVKTNNLSDLSSISTAKVNLSLVKADVGLGNVDNTSDANKPVSTVQATAIALKANAANAALTGTTTAVAITASGLITPSSPIGIKGTIAADNAQAGSIGEIITGVASVIPLGNGSVAFLTSISLTAGDWDVQTTVKFIPAGTTTLSFQQIGVSTSSTAFGALGTSVTTFDSRVAGQGDTLTSPVTQINVAATTPVYIVAQANFAVSTCTASGFIRARRIR